MPSTVIASFSYNADRHALTIVFVSGMVYQYKNVPEEIYKAMKSSTSKGIYFNKHIKDKYEFEKMSCPRLQLIRRNPQFITLTSLFAAY